MDGSFQVSAARSRASDPGRLAAARDDRGSVDIPYTLGSRRPRQSLRMRFNCLKILSMPHSGTSRASFKATEQTRTRLQNIDGNITSKHLIRGLRDEHFEENAICRYRCKCRDNCDAICTGRAGGSLSHQRLWRHVSTGTGDARSPGPRPRGRRHRETAQVVLSHTLDSRMVARTCVG